MFQPIFTPRDIAERYHRFLPEEVRSYLKGRGIPSTLIADQLLGWDCKRITIPIFGSQKEVLGFRYVTFPKDVTDAPVFSSDPDAEPQIYGLEVLARKPHRVVICEDEFDALVLRAHGIPAVCSTAGAETFLAEWARFFADIADVYICFNRSSASETAANKVQAILRKARIARLPSDVGESGSTFDYFLLLGKELKDFELVLAASVAASADPADTPPPIAVSQPASKPQRTRAERVRKRISLHEVVWQFANLQASGGRLVGHCPFHEDRSRSFTVYPEANVYRCSVCGAEGDAVRFLMDKESMTFGQALEALERFEFTHELYGTSS